MYKVVIKVQLVYSEDIKNKARKMIKGGTIIGIAIFLIETGEVTDIKYNEQEARMFCLSHNIKDDTLYASMAVKLQEVIL